jgi:hypothetical protein
MPTNLKFYKIKEMKNAFMQEKLKTLKRQLRGTRSNNRSTHSESGSTIGLFNLF